MPTRDAILEAIRNFCENNTSRQREDLYKHLNAELGLNLDVYNYDGRSDHAKFACDRKAQEWETAHILQKLKT